MSAPLIGKVCITIFVAIEGIQVHHTPFGQQYDLATIQGNRQGVEE
jgi:hypothetical protein|tara:strand:- start:1554 stop:1691 length:138 start_codon:yes stop_codon:yes gene_type:complete